MLSGVYAGSLTNTPALAASTEHLQSELPIVGYSVTYLGGVLGMLIAAGIAARTKAPADRAERTAPPPKLERRHGAHRPRRPARPRRARGALRPPRGVLPAHDRRRARPPRHPRPAVPTTGRSAATSSPWSATARPCTVIDDLGHLSTVRLVADRSALDYRRIAVSNRRIAGRTLGDLDLPGQFGVTATRVRRGDIDLLATDDLVLALGDRVRVVGPTEAITTVAKHLGDSERGATDINPVGLFLGLGIGLLVGLIQVPLPGGSTVSLGIAGGPLLVGLVVGRLQRTGPVLWSLPHSVSATLTQLGMLMFLAYAGSNAGAALADALASDLGPRLLGDGCGRHRPRGRRPAGVAAALRGVRRDPRGRRRRHADPARGARLRERRDRRRPAGEPRLRARLPGRDDRQGDPRADHRRLLIPDFTSWWPRPKAEGVIDELAQLQGDAAPLLPHGPASALPPGVRAGGAFPKADGEGYDAAQVDVFMANARHLSAEQVAAAVFATSDKRAYDRKAVDAALARLQAEAAAREA